MDGLIGPLRPDVDRDPLLVRVRAARALLEHVDQERIEPRFLAGLEGLEQMAQGMARLGSSGLCGHATELAEPLERLVGAVEAALEPLQGRRARRGARRTGRARADSTPAPAGDGSASG